MRALIIAGILGTSCAAASAQTPGFWPMGMPPGTTQGWVTALSGDGTVAVGHNGGGIPVAVPGFSWTAAQGRYDFGLEPGMPLQSGANGVTTDGGTIVGFMQDVATSRRAYRRIGNGPLENLGVLPGYTDSYANGVSGDGNAVVGYAQFEQFGPTQAFRWTPQSGMQPLGWLPNSSRSEALAISRDGSTIVGYSTLGTSQAFVWRDAIGMQALPPAPGNPGGTSTARGLNADGSVVVGDAGSLAARWTGSGVELLGTLPGLSFSTAYAVNDDGSIVGGTAPIGGGTALAVLWLPGTGITTLDDYLQSHGVLVPHDWELISVFAISGDGMAFAGDARSPAGVRQGFVATIPAPAGVAVLILPALLCLRRRRGM